MRRVVTGMDEAGKAVFVSDGAPGTLAMMEGGPQVPLIWGWDEAPVAPNDGARPSCPAFFPSPPGMRVLVAPIPHDGEEVVLPERAPGEPEGPGPSAVWDPDVPGMHTTQTVDVGLVLEGTVLLELDDGATRQLDAGDWYVINGTRHAWRNPFGKRALLAVLVFGAEPA